MSRIGNKTITIPEGVDVSVTSGNEVTVKGPKGSLQRQFSTRLVIEVKDNEVNVSRLNEEKHTKQLHGTTRALIANMIEGCHKEFVKELLVVGIGFKVAVVGNQLQMNIGYSHRIDMDIPEGIKVVCASATSISVSGIDKQVVGEFAANVRAKRKPEPYKGKGIQYRGEKIRRKEGKTAAKK